MTVTTSTERLERLRAQLSDARATTRSTQRMTLSRSSNMMIGIALHASARLKNGLPLSDLEQRVVDAMRTVLPEEEIKEYGALYQQRRASRSAAELFPDAITRLPVETGYTWAQLTQDAPALGKDVLAQPNVRVVNIAQRPPGQGSDDEAFTEALAQYGGGITLLRGEPLTGAARETPIYVKMRFSHFHCDRESGESGRDEIYWVSAAGADSMAKQTYESAEFGAISTGDTEYFPSESIMFRGQVNQRLTFNIQCWEADHSSGGFYNDLRSALRDIAEAAVEAALSLADDPDGGDAAGWAAMIAIVAGLLNWLLGLLTNDDDLVLERSYGMSKSALRTQAAMANGEDWWDFNGGDGGRHRLYIRATLN
ncbi:hypothetical protein BO221_45685 [Archangium sp. Cb G35]|uniref:hypothetical protein n=1 Tax=Archangium sp. Cb G35 TaxID=1920190 RepID=UPI000935CC63|nr:hypothetical protein [Archangium sp. Cb G35]OJT17411.1 hypothetical protein BO221_45685 [Archangium sp. Cb G35]